MSLCGGRGNPDPKRTGLPTVWDSPELLQPHVSEADGTPREGLVGHGRSPCKTESLEASTRTWTN